MASCVLNISDPPLYRGLLNNIKQPLRTFFTYSVKYFDLKSKYLNS